MERQPDKFTARELKDRKGAATIVGLQFFLTLVPGGLLSLMQSRELAMSWLIGGGMATLANAWFSWKFFFSPAPVDPAIRVNRIYRAELGKFVLLTAFFVMAFAGYRPLKEPQNTLALFTGFCLVYMQTLLAPRFMQWQKPGRNKR